MSWKKKYLFASLVLMVIMLTGLSIAYFTIGNVKTGCMWNVIFTCICSNWLLSAIIYAVRKE